MVKDTKYYFEVFVSENGGGDNAYLQMQQPDGIWRDVRHSDLEPWAPSY